MKVDRDTKALSSRVTVPQNGRADVNRVHLRIREAHFQTGC